jgi:uncharacterized protein
LKIEQETRYPWDGAVKMTVNPDVAAPLTIHVRIPGWARNQPVASDLYRFADTSAAPVTLQDQWPAGSAEAGQGLRLADAHVAARRHHRAEPADAGAARGGERPGSGGSRASGAAARSHRVRRRMAGQSQRAGAQFAAAGWRAAAGGVQAGHAEGRGGGARQGDCAGVRRARQDRPDRAGIHRDPLLRVGQPRARADDGVVSHRRSACQTAALPDRRQHRQSDGVRPEPAGSADHQRRRRTRVVGRSHGYFDWWPRKGTSEWVEYAFENPPRFRSAGSIGSTTRAAAKCACRPRGGCCIARGTNGNRCAPANRTASRKDGYNRVAFEPVSTSGLRLEVAMQPNWSAGIQQWRVK